MKLAAINIVLDGKNRSAHAFAFVEIETDDGKSIRVGEWVTRSDGLHAIRIPNVILEAKDSNLELLEVVAVAGKHELGFIGSKSS